MGCWDTIKARSKSCFFSVYDKHYKFTLGAMVLLLLALLVTLLAYINQKIVPPPSPITDTATAMA